MGHTLITTEIGSLKRPFRSDDLWEHMGVQLMLHAIPVEFFTGINQTIVIADTNPTSQFPQLHLVIIPSRIGLNISLDMELLIKLFKENALHKLPAVRLANDIHVPSLCDDAILDDTWVGNQRIHPVCSHHWHRVTGENSTSRMFLRFLTTGRKQ